MTKLFLFPGDKICDAFGVAQESDHRQILSMLLNTMIWSVIGIGMALKVAL